MLPRLYALECVGGDVELVCPERMPRFAEELLERVLPSHCTIHRFPVDTLVRYDAVRLSPFTTIMGKGLLRPEIASWLRERLLGHPLGRRGPTRRVYVSRAGAAWHRVGNEEEVVAALAAFGVESVRTEDLSVGEQLELFADADLVVGAHGAGLANMLASHRAAVVELSPSGIGSRLQLAYWSLARSCGHRYVAVPHAGERYLEHFAVDVNRLVRAVELAVGASPGDPMAAVVSA